MSATPEREGRIFNVARKLPVEERAFYLDGACAGDAVLRRQVEELLAANDAAGAFLSELATAGDNSLKPGVLPVPTKTLREEHRPSAQPGDTFGRYKLLEKIGEGGFGVVYVAEQREPVKRRVALKIIKLGMDTRQVVARFEAERQALALMDHPNIAKVLDAGATEDGRPFFVMELVKGIPITKYCDQEKLGIRERLDLFIKVCHAIQHAHQKGIIHRDIKPSNILVTLHDGVPVPKVIDFGIAKATQQELTEKTVYTQLQQFIGTPAYMSPEQAEVSGLDIDTRSDIYSLGVLLYELLTGSTPFDTKELLKSGLDEMRKIIREREPVRPSTRLSQTRAAQPARPGESALRTPHSAIDTDLDWIVMKCLEKDRARRYEAANGVAQDIERHLQHEPVMARPPSVGYRLQKSFRRNRLVFTAVGAVGLALVLGVVVSSWQAMRAIKAGRREAEAARVADSQRERAEKGEQKARESELAARQEAYAADISLAQQALAMNDLGRAKRLLDGHRPRPGETDLRGWEWRYLWRECRSDALGELCRNSNAVYVVAYAPDGKTLAVAGYAIQPLVEIWDVPGRKRIATLQTNTGNLVAFSPRGDLLATGGYEQEGINIWRAGTTNLVRQIAHPNWVRVLKFSPDGSRLASLNDQGEVAVWEVGRWAIIRRIPGPTGMVNVHDGAVDFSPDGKALAIGDGEGRLRVIDLDTGNTRFNIIAHPEMVSAVAWSPTAPILASGCAFQGGPIHLWDANSGKPIGSLEGHTAWIARGLIFSADGKLLYSASADQTIRIWDVGEKRCLAILRGSNDEVWGLALSRDGTTLASSSKDGVVAFWSALPHSKEEQPGRLPTGPWGRAAFAPDGRAIAESHEGVVHLYELPALRQIETIPALGTNVSVVAYSPDGTLIVSGSTKGWLRVWSCTGRRLLKEFPGLRRSVRWLRFSSDGVLLFSSDSDDDNDYYGGELICWDSRTWQRLWSLGAENTRYLASVSPDGRLAITGTEAGELSWWNTASRNLLAAAPGHGQIMAGAAFSPDGTRAASVSTDGRVALWDASSFRPIITFKGHMHGAMSVAFSPDGRRLATGGTGRDAVKLWDLATYRELVTLPGQGEMFEYVIFSPNGNWLAARSWEGQLHLWHAPSWAEIEAAEKQTKGRTQ